MPMPTTDFPTKWGLYEYEYDQDSCVTISGEAQFGGQDYLIRLLLFKGEDGWRRAAFDDLVMTKIGGDQDGRPARPAARELVLNYLPEHFNDVIGDKDGNPLD